MIIAPRFGIVARSGDKTIREATDGTDLSAVRLSIIETCEAVGWENQSGTLVSRTQAAFNIGNPVTVGYEQLVGFSMVINGSLIEFYIGDNQGYLFATLPMRLYKSSQYYIMASRYQVIIVSKGPVKGLISAILISSIHVPTIYLPNDLEGKRLGWSTANPNGYIVNAIVGCESNDLFNDWSGYSAINRAYCGLLRKDGTVGQWTKTSGGGPLLYPMLPNTNFFPTTDFKIKSPAWIAWSPTNPTLETPLLWGFLWDLQFLMKQQTLFTGFNLDRRANFPFAYARNNTLCFEYRANERTTCSL